MSLYCTLTKENGRLQLSIEMSSSLHSKVILEAMERLNLSKLTWTYSDDHAVQVMLYLTALQVLERSLQQLMISDCERQLSN